MVTNRLLDLVGGPMGARRNDKNKARSLGYIVVEVNEHYTSKKCPMYENFVGQVDIRRLHCSRCKTFMHRNAMVGHNICNTIRGHLLNQHQPRYFQPRDANAYFPWPEGERSAATTTSGPATTNFGNAAIPDPILDAPSKRAFPRNGLAEVKRK
ncbi:hypothetical protein BGZ47_000283 [Haplosporangium gracile]|nr:hypothetical protein BGZ47_000283 [Haplosporangium gracile]